MAPLSCFLSAAGIRFLGVLFPPRDSASLAVGLPPRLRGRDGQRATSCRNPHRHKRASRSAALRHERSRPGLRVSSRGCGRLAQFRCAAWWPAAVTCMTAGFGGTGVGRAAPSVCRGPPVRRSYVPEPCRVMTPSGCGTGRRRRACGAGKPGGRAVSVTAPIPAVRGQVFSCPWLSGSRGARTCSGRRRPQTCLAARIRWSARLTRVEGERSVKPSAQPTLVRTQHLPPPAKTAR